MIKRKKSADVNIREYPACMEYTVSLIIIDHIRYEDSFMFRKFENVRQYLIDQKLEDPRNITAKELSVLTGQFIQFMEDYLGRDVCTRVSLHVLVRDIGNILHS